MIYAKCIRGSQIAKSKDDLEKMKEISKYTVYCEGEEAVPKNSYASLYCVPLNCIFQCLKYGNYIAIIENEEFDYTKDYDGNATASLASVSSKIQKIGKILDPRKKEVIDYILKEVGDIYKIFPGHASEDNLGKETYEYLEAKLELPKRYNYI